MNIILILVVVHAVHVVHVARRTLLIIHILILNLLANLDTL